MVEWVATSNPMKPDWFWSEYWQAREREAQENIDEGRVKSFSSAEELIAELNRKEK